MISEWAILILDRFCRTLAIALKALVFTTEHLWKGLKLGAPIHVIR
jgi:PIN domain nuclease of toxin-antitoxin system